MNDPPDRREPLDWRAWHQDYDNPDSPVSHRLIQVRARLALALGSRPGPVRVLSLCSGDARDTIPVVAAADRTVSVTLVEREPGLAARAADAAVEAGVAVDLRVGDAGDPTTYADVLPVDVLLLVGVLGNVSDADARTTVAATASMVVPGGVVIWSRSNRFRAAVTHAFADPAAWVGSLPDRAPLPDPASLPTHLFTFLR